MCRSSCLWLALAGLLAIACSSTSAPPVNGDCTGNGEGGCSMGGSGGGGSSSGGSGGDGGGGGADAGACQVSSTQSQCDQCAGAACCSQLDSCGSSLPCRNVLGCFYACTAGSSCASTCEKQYPGVGANLFQYLEQCLAVRCLVCAQLGTGDPCWDSTAQCNIGLSCMGLWCTKTCINSTQCTGLGANGGNFTGHGSNACRRIPSGSWCFPGCASDADCTDFPGTYCVQTTDVSGATVAVCQAGPDGGLD